MYAIYVTQIYENLAQYGEHNSSTKIAIYTARKYHFRYFSYS